MPALYSRPVWRGIDQFEEVDNETFIQNHTPQEQGLTEMCPFFIRFLYARLMTSWPHLCAQT